MPNGSDQLYILQWAVWPVAMRAHVMAQNGDESGRSYAEFLNETAQLMRAERGLDSAQTAEPSSALASRFHAQTIRRDAQGIGFGRAACEADLRQQLVFCPNQEALPEEVIWSGTQALGFLGAQRLLLRGHHRGAGQFGAPTGRRLCYREMSEIYGKSGRISDIWTLRDTAAICAQLDLNPEMQAARLLASCDTACSPFRPEVDSQGPYTGLGNDNQWGIAFGELLNQLMAGAVNQVVGQYDPACQLCHPGGVVEHGPSGAASFWLGLRSSFPNARFQVHHCLGLSEALMPPRAALRWSLQGKHEGWGPFGAPSGAEVHVMGLSHVEFGPAGLRREWTLFDALAIWMQIVAHKG